MSQPASFGSLLKSAVNVNVSVSVPDIKFPISVRLATDAVGTTQQQDRPVPATQQASVRSSAGAVGTTTQQGRPVPATQQDSVRSSAGAVGTTKQPGRPVPATQQASVRSSAGAVGTTKQPDRPVPATQQDSVRSSAGAVGTTKQPGRQIPGTQQASLGQIKATSIGTFKVKTKEDKECCNIAGIAITPSGQRLLVDNWNQKVKLFSQDMRILSSVTVPGDYFPWDITVVNDREAVVTVGQSLVFLEVTDRQLRVKHTINLSFYAYGITYSKDKLIVTDFTTIHALDLRGTELWSVGQPLFQEAQYVFSNSDGRWVAVTDYRKNTVTLLDVNNGAVITSTQLENQGDYGPLGVSVDGADDIYVCAKPNIVVLSGDLKNEHVLGNLGGNVIQTIAYDDKKHQLIISHGSIVICLQLS